MAPVSPGPDPNTVAECILPVLPLYVLFTNLGELTSSDISRLSSPAACVSGLMSLVSVVSSALSGFF